MHSSPAHPRIPERQSKGPRIVKGWSPRNKRRVLRHAQQPCVSKCTAALHVQMHNSPAHPRIPERSRRGRVLQKGGHQKITAGILRHAQQPCASRCSAALRVQMHNTPAYASTDTNAFAQSLLGCLYKNCPSNSWGESQGRYRHLKSKAFAHCKIPSKNYKIPSF